MSVFRDDRAALRLRNEALERELEAARRELGTMETELGEARGTIERARGDIARLTGPGAPARRALPVALEPEGGRSLAPVGAPAPRWLAAVAHGASMATFVASPLTAFLAPRAWPALVVVAVVALAASVVHLRPNTEAPSGRLYYAFMAAMGVVPFGGLFTPLPCGVVFWEYERRSAIPYAITAVSLCCAQIWWFLAWP